MSTAKPTVNVGREVDSLRIQDFVLVDFDAYVPVLAGDILSLRRYRRNRIPGGTYFFTVTLRERRSQWLVQHIDRLRDVFRAVHERQPFQLDAIVILPGHVHAVWTLQGMPTIPADAAPSRARFPVR